MKEYFVEDEKIMAFDEIDAIRDYFFKKYSIIDAKSITTNEQVIVNKNTYQVDINWLGVEDCIPCLKSGFKNRALRNMKISLIK